MDSVPTSRLELGLRVVTGPDGRFTLDGLLPVRGSWNLYAKEPGGLKTEEQAVELRSSSDRAAVKLRLRVPRGAVEGVVSVNGRPRATSIG